MLDTWTITKPNLSASVTVQLSAPPNVTPGGPLVYSMIVSNDSSTPLSGVQVRLTPATGFAFAGTVTPYLTVQGTDIVATMGHMDPGVSQEIQIATTAPSNAQVGSTMTASATLTSGTGLPVAGNFVSTTVTGARKLF